MLALLHLSQPHLLLRFVILSRLKFLQMEYMICYRQLLQCCDNNHNENYKLAKIKRWKSYHRNQEEKIYLCRQNPYHHYILYFYK